MVAVKPDGAYLFSSFSQLAYNATGWDPGDVLRLEVRTVTPNTAHLTVYQNGTALFSYDDTEHFVANGQPGIGLFASTAGMSLDNWEGGNTVLAPRPSGTTPPVLSNEQPPGPPPTGATHTTLSLVASGHASPTPTRTPTSTPAPSPANPAGLANVSTRLFVQTGDNVMIGGFIIAETFRKTSFCAPLALL